MFAEKILGPLGNIEDTGEQTWGSQWAREWPACHSRSGAEPVPGPRSWSQSPSLCWFLCAGTNSSPFWQGVPSPGEKECGPWGPRDPGPRSLHLSSTALSHPSPWVSVITSTSKIPLNSTHFLSVPPSRSLPLLKATIVCCPDNGPALLLFGVTPAYLLSQSLLRVKARGRSAK